MIIPAIRQMTFAGFRIVFSSVIPLDVPPEATDIWRTAVAFGAECYKELNPRITHVVANKVVFFINTSLESRGTNDLALLFDIEGDSESRPSSASSTNHEPIDQNCLACMVQRLPCTMEAARRDSLSPRRPFTATFYGYAMS